MKHSHYEVFPGRQHYVVMIPQKYSHLFLEGVQSIDSNPNTEDTDYGQYGFTDPVIQEKAFKNETGTITINNYGYASRVLRAMAGQDHETSFLYDKSYNQKVDFFENVFNKTRDKVVMSRYWFDAINAVSGKSDLEGVETYDLEFAASRMLEFENKQIVVQSFTDTAVGQKTFTLMSPAIVDPVLADVSTNPATGLTTGNRRHELCPIQFALRVWVDGIVLNDSKMATISTSIVGTTLISTLFLDTPLAKAGQVVKCAWLADGATSIAQGGVTYSSVIVQAVPKLDKTASPVKFDKSLNVYISRLLSASSLATIVPGDFALTWTAGANTYKWTPSSIDTTKAVSSNLLVLDFNPGTLVDQTNTVASVDLVAGTPSLLSYSGVSMITPDGYVSPFHAKSIPAFT